jgi:nicotinate-nucleotide adenylyltransferase
MHIALFGGAFDPPHSGHQLVAASILHEQLADEVWFLPASKHPFLKPLSPASDRVAMLEAILQPHQRIETYELDHDTTSYTYTTLAQLRLRHPEHTFSFIIGSDNLANFHTWDEHEKLIAEFPFFVYPRPGFPMEPLYPNMTPLSNTATVTTSSTEVRENVQLSKSIAPLVHPNVALYIHNQGLYANDR